MAERHVFPQTGDRDDAENFNQMIGHDLLSNQVTNGLSLSPDYTVPEVDISTGVCFIRRSSATASSTGETRLDATYVVQLPSVTKSLTDNTVNYVYVDPGFGTNDNASIEVYIDQTNPGSDELEIGSVDTSNDTVNEVNRGTSVQQATIRDLLHLLDDVRLCFGDEPDFCLEYNTTSDELELYDDVNDTLKQSWDKSGDTSVPNGALQVGSDIETTGSITVWSASNNHIPQARLEHDTITVAGNSVSLGGSTTVSYGDLSNTGSFPIANGDLSNSDVTVAGNTVVLGGSTTVSYGDLSNTGSFPIANGDLSNSDVTVAGNTVSLGGSTSIGHGDLSGVGSSNHHSRYSDEEAQDAAANALNGGSSISVSYDDSNSTITIDYTGSGGGSYSDENAQDAVGSILTGTGSATITYDDSNDTIEVYADTNTEKSFEEIDDRVASILTESGGTTIQYNDSNDTIDIFSEEKRTYEEIEDQIGTSIDGGTDISVSYDDFNGTTTIDYTGSGGSSYSDEDAQDAVASALSGDSKIDISYDDGGNTINLTAPDAGSGMYFSTTADEYIVGSSDSINTNSNSVSVNINSSEGIQSTSSGIQVDEDEPFNWTGDHTWEAQGGGLSNAIEFANGSGTAFMQGVDSGSAGAELEVSDSDGNSTIIT